MRLAKTISELHQYLQPYWQNQTSIGFVPTMGALHEGHASLIRRAKKENQITVLSIFVNPTQFGPNEDYERYPRTLEHDLSVAYYLGVDVVFAPEVKEMYPTSPQIQIRFPEITRYWCGAYRPGHFEGVALVVAKLFHLVRPTMAYFGQKDYQQSVVIRRLVEELNFPIEIVVCPTVRESDGLALSSRNRYLNEEERKQAIALYKTLCLIKKESKEEKRVEALIEKGKSFLANYPLVRLEYLGIADGNTLEPLEQVERERNPIALIAAYVGNARLIDNLFLHDHADSGASF